MTISHNAVIGQSGGPTSAINATLAGVIAGCLDAGFPHIYGMKNGVEGFLNEDLLDLAAVFPSSDCPALAALSSTPAAALGSCRKKINSDELIERMYRLFDKYDISYFFYIGGNDSMDAVKQLEGYASRHPEARKMFFIGVPKTIDNDLLFTDHTPGFGSAAKFIASSMREMIRDCAVYTTRAVTIIEIMGRDAGWLTASAALSGIGGEGPALVYLPERPFSEEAFLQDLENEFKKEKPYVIVAVSEGLRDAEGHYVAEAAMSGAADVFGHKYLAGTGKYLENLVRDKIGCKVRSVELNILQRCAGHIASKTDLDESQAVGRHAVRLAVEGKSGRMATIVRTGDAPYTTTCGDEDASKIANGIKTVPDNFINEAGNGVTKACLDYLLPLIQGEAETAYENGMPKHFTF